MVVPLVFVIGVVRGEEVEQVVGVEVGGVRVPGEAGVGVRVPGRQPRLEQDEQNRE